MLRFISVQTCVTYLTDKGDTVSVVLHCSRWSPEECNWRFSDVLGIEVRHSNHGWKEIEEQRIDEYTNGVNFCCIFQIYFLYGTNLTYTHLFSIPFNGLVPIPAVITLWTGLQSITQRQMRQTIHSHPILTFLQRLMKAHLNLIIAWCYYSKHILFLVMTLVLYLPKHLFFVLLCFL